MKLSQVVVLVLMVTAIAGCSRRETPVASNPAASGGSSAADRARADSIAAAELARRQAEERDRRSAMARVQENLRAPIFFQYDSETLDNEAQDILRDKASIMRANPAVALRIEGHADERGSTEYNLALGQRRAESVRTFLSGYGITGNRLSTISYGKERPDVEGSNETAWERNRRAEFAVTAGEVSVVPPDIR